MAKKTAKNEAVFCPFTVASFEKGAMFVYGIRAAEKTSIFSYQTHNGSDFSNKCELEILSEKGKKEKLINCGEISFFSYGKHHYLTYGKILRGKRKTFIARSDDAAVFQTIMEADNFPEGQISVVLNNKHIHKHNFLAYYGGKSICVAASSNLSDWFSSGDILCPRKDYFDSGHLRVIGTLFVEKGILVLYQAINSKKLDYSIKIGAALFSFDRPYVPIWRSDEPLWEERKDKKTYPAQFLGSVIIGNSLHIYCTSFGNEISSKIIDLSASGLLKSTDVRQLCRHVSNPILEPKAHNHWEKDATFNPAALHLDGRIHLIYRAIGENGVSVFRRSASACPARCRSRRQEVRLPPQVGPDLWRNGCARQFFFGRIAGHKIPQRSGDRH